MSTLIPISRRLHKTLKQLVSAHEFSLQSTILTRRGIHAPPKELRALLGFAATALENLAFSASEDGLRTTLLDLLQELDRPNRYRVRYAAAEGCLKRALDHDAHQLAGGTARVLGQGRGSNCRDRAIMVAREHETRLRDYLARGYLSVQ